MILRADPVAQTLTTLVTLGGSGASATPAGGTYNSATSAPAVDTAGAVTFSASIDAATTSEALIWDPPAGAAQAILIGDAVPEPSSGFFGGPPFFAPKLNNTGDVIFKSYVTKGPALGIFRYRQGTLEALVRIQDAAPLPPLKGATLPPRFTGTGGRSEPQRERRHRVRRDRRGRGTRGVRHQRWDAAVHRHAARRPRAPDSAPTRGLLPHDRSQLGPQRLGRRRVSRHPPVLQPARLYRFFPRHRESDVFLADQSGIHVIAAQGDDSGVPGQPLFAFHDPSIVGNQVTFRANLGIIDGGPNGRPSWPTRSACVPWRSSSRISAP